MRFKGLDLNLLVALDALLEEASVTRAAERLYLSQPAASAALARLREWFGDPLLSAHGKRMVPTPYALRLKPMLKSVLTELDVLVGQPTNFSPETEQRRVRVCTADYITSVALAPLSLRLAELAPGIALEVVPPDDNAGGLLDRGEIDLLIVPAEWASLDHPVRPLLEEHHVVAGWNRNPLFQREGAIDKAAFTAAGHVTVRIGRLSRLSFAEAQLRAGGITRREEVVVPGFAQVPPLLVGTQRLAVMHARLAQDAARHYPIAFAPLPFAMPPMRETVQYHRARANDPVLLWLLDRLDEAVSERDRQNPVPFAA
ncbi:LysR family transcriptional regulator [Novosphingobium olei]|uniref:LysR family transcriptional regulator n=1 Tax=Novosphingobium olei TaxID=2728851 RepID=UPI00308CFEA7|nr:LysR family transcriptional regulator [Novosphingobium olei]